MALNTSATDYLRHMARDRDARPGKLYYGQEERLFICENEA
jgi:hypothetical protein